MAQLNAGRAGPPKSGRKRAGEDGGKQFFQHACPSSHPPSAAFVTPRCLFSSFSESTSESMMQPRMSRENIVAFVRDILFQCDGPSGNITIPLVIMFYP